MQREIKFRAWVKNNVIQEMHYADEIQINSADAKSFQFRVGFEDAFPEKNNIEQWQKDIVWMQFTGLRDRNGKEIYENDIVKILYTDWMSKSENDPRTIDEYKNDIAVKGVVKFKDCEFGLEICSDNLDSIFCGKHGFIEVIGNTFENVNLMQGVS